MVFKTLHLARQSLAKTFTHGYAQSIVAASQSSYASQTNSFSQFSINVNNRHSKTSGSHIQNAFHNTDRPSTTTAAGKAVHPNQTESDLAAYYAAWQKHQRVGEHEWQQFQFAKRIEWKPPTTVPDGISPAKDAVIVEEDVFLAPTRTGIERAYSASAVDDFKKAVGDEEDEAIAIAQVDEAIAQEIEKVREDVKDETAKSEASATPTSSRDATPSSASEASTDASPQPESTVATSISEEVSYTDRLNKLVENRHYEKIPAVFESMLLADIKPTVSAYHALLLAAIHLPLGKHQVVPKALDVYSDMLRRHVVPNTAIYSTLIELLSVRALNVLAMKQVLDEKRERFGGVEEAGRFMLKSNETEYDILVEDDSLATAIKLFDAATAIHQHRSFSEKTYRSLISACAEQGKVDDMVRIFGHMETQKVIPHPETFVPMIHALALSGDLRSAVECYDGYKTLAISNDKGDLSMVRKDNDVYAALIKAYAICNRLEGGQKFLKRVETVIEAPELIAALQETVALKAFVPYWLNVGSFEQAFAYAVEHLNSRARNLAMAGITIKAADRNEIEIAMKSFDSLDGSIDVSGPAMAIAAMHVRLGDIEAADRYWTVLEFSTPKPQYIESTTMQTIALIGSGQSDRGISQSRRMFSRIRESQTSSKQAQLEAVDQIDEAIEVIGTFMAKRCIYLSPSATMEMLQTMIENGGVVPSVAIHVIAGLQPEHIASLGWSDLNLLMQVQAGMIINGSRDINDTARFTHLLSLLTSRGLQIESQTSRVIEKGLVRLNRPDLVSQWQGYKYPVQEQHFSPSSYHPVQKTAARVVSAEDSYDPYAATTDNKGSVAITDLLDKAHGRSSSHLNEALTKFRNMRRAGRHPRFFTYAKLITAAAKENRLNLAHDILGIAKQDVPFLPEYRIVRYGWVTILDAMVAACLTNGRRELAAQYHQELLSMGAAPSANTFGLYITTLKESTKTFDEASEAVRIFQRAKTEGVEPSSFLYNALIGKLGKARRIDDSLFYFTEMRNLGIRPTSVTYGTIVNALCRVSDEKFAEELFEEMESMPNYKPRPAPYHSLMQFFLTTKRDRSKVLAYYDRMRSKNIMPTTHTYKLLIDTYATLEPVDMAAAERILEQVQTSGEQPDAVHYASLIHAKGCVMHDMAGARQLFDKVLSEGLVRPQACLYQSLFEAMVANHKIEDTQAVLKNMSARGVDLTPYIANSLIHGWAMAKDINKAKVIYDTVPLDKREPSTYEAMTRAYMAVEDRDGAMSVVNEGLSRGYPAAVANKIMELVNGARAAALLDREPSA
ncbi:hypothetical protein M501DRAFT_927214 [Patellaria atrata CBS 101060]|uniref:Tetratricopeptide repeat domain-containing protein n=1 Tax=Patellaria atrata CBS 101060 TaxID=1346257 RepID=A0A9P4SGN6_9PEZI|nr:hypothetical protein M501DRAFT_927214 [Patellaria atrata CBS 101060]